MDKISLHFEKPRARNFANVLAFVKNLPTPTLTDFLLHEIAFFDIVCALHSKHYKRLYNATKRGSKISLTRYEMCAVVFFAQKSPLFTAVYLELQQKIS